MILSEHILGDLTALYLQREGSRRCELLLVPSSHRGKIAQPRKLIEGRENEGLVKKYGPIGADMPQSLVWLKLLQDDADGAFSSGITLAESWSMGGLVYEKQEVRQDADLTCIDTFLRHGDDAVRFRCMHRLVYRQGERGVRLSVEFINQSAGTLSLEMLSSFALNNLSPFCAGDPTSRLVYHRFRSWWSLEGRLDSQSLEVLHLSRSWHTFPHFRERIGQLGTMPVRQFFPTAALEDKVAGVTWGVQLGWAGSWQIDLHRRGDRLTLCGGLADREFGHWVKHVAPGESFHSPEAYVTAVTGGVEEACRALLDGQRAAAAKAPEVERDLPVAFNEWCTTWGSPTNENVLAIARRLEGSGVRYIVIDDGWAVRPPEANAQANGDWIIEEKKFPGGLKPTCDALRAMGYIPGIWFEFEVVNPSATVWSETDHLLKRDGRPLVSGVRRFWDFNDPWVEEYLTKKVIHLLRDNGFGYLKVDYNDNLGIGCDHPDSPGEGLRSYVAGVQRFFRRLREAIPDLVIENCSSGGHRLEPSMQALASMGSFSDAHETVIIPIIARNLQRLILPRQSLIWAVLQADDSLQRVQYSLAATFLGRMCLSGTIHELSDEQMAAVKAAVTLYREAADVIDQGVSTFHGTPEGDYFDPKGWQAVVRSTAKQLLIVAHGFELAEALTVTVPLPAGEWRRQGNLGQNDSAAELRGDQFSFQLTPGFTGGVWLFSRDGSAAP